jgi:hypothetical protein
VWNGVTRVIANDSRSYVEEARMRSPIPEKPLVHSLIRLVPMVSATDRRSLAASAQALSSGWAEVAGPLAYSAIGRLGWSVAAVHESAGGTARRWGRRVVARRWLLMG